MARPRHLAIAYLAGGVAKGLLLSGLTNGDLDDTEEVKNLMCVILAEEGMPVRKRSEEQLMRHLQHDTEALIIAHKGHIEMLAHALLKSPTRCLLADGAVALLDSVGMGGKLMPGNPRCRTH